MDPFDSENLVLFGKSPVNWVLEICAKQAVLVKFDVRDTRTDPTADPNFETNCIIENYQGKALTATQFGRNKKEAKHRVCIEMLNLMGIKKCDLLQIGKCSNKANANGALPMAMAMAVKDNTDTDQEPQAVRAPAAISGQSAITSGEHSTNGIDMSLNHLGELIEFCAQQSLGHPIFEVVSQAGPSHMPIFSMTCRISIPGQQEPYLVKETRCSSTKIIKKILAAEMLEKLRGDAENLKKKVQKGDKFLKNEENTVVNQIETFMSELRLGLKSSACSMRRCGTLFAHVHHELQQMTGPVVSQVKELINEDKLLELDSLDHMKKLQDEQRHFGRASRLKFIFGKTKTGGACCYVRYKYHVAEYAMLGEGPTDDSAQRSGAKKMLEFLIELTIN